MDSKRLLFFQCLNSTHYGVYHLFNVWSWLTSAVAVQSNHIIQLSFTVQPVMSCPHCKKTFTKTSSLTRHLRERHERNTARIQCDLCQKSFVHLEHYRRYVHVVHNRAFTSQTSQCHGIESKGFHVLMHLEPNSDEHMNIDLPTNQAHLEPNSEEHMNMDLPTNQAHQLPIEQMIFDDGSGQLDLNGHIDPDLLLVDPELFALLTHFFNNISSSVVCYIMLHL